MSSLCRRPGFRRLAELFALCAAAALPAYAGPGAGRAEQGKGVQFGRDIRPILARSCLACHGARRRDGGLRLDLRSRALLGGDSGPTIVPRDPAGSELIRRLTTADAEHRMPLGAKPLPPAQIELVRRWIAEGADWPDEFAGKEDFRDHWSFRPIRRPEVPKVGDAARVRNPIDAFVLAKLERKNLTLAPEADPRTLIRRLYLDLIGLPPTPEEVDAFINEWQQEGARRQGEAGRSPAAKNSPPLNKGGAGGVTSPNPPTPPTRSAYERLVDRLLASPHFGERWGRHWLDLARFAESDGYENDRIRPNAWRFRDWVVDAVNRDLPFDQFTIEQLAGDLLLKASSEQRIAAGFHRNTLWNSAASADKEEFRTYAVKDRTDTTGTVWMGLTVGCAKCHSHKYDPVSQKEYYQLYAFFNNVEEEDVPLADGKAQSLRAAQRENYVHLRGSFLQKGPAVGPATPAFLPPLKPRGDVPDRLDLARWLVDPKHPLTPRVAVNRVWQHLFGQGLVPTPENFGLSGQPPVQMELLDWLAAGFAAAPSSKLRTPSSPSNGAGPELGARSFELGWSQKALIRLIVTSAVYRQSSDWRPELAETDPENALLARQNRFRVEAEIVRDLSLSVSGLLDPKLGGPSIVPPFPKGLLEQRFTNEDLKLPGAERHRRGIYIHVQRTLTHPSLAAFDAADGNQACVRRDRSITPIQALTLLNDPVFTECARALGRRLRKAAPSDPERLRLAFRLCLAREGSPEELAALTDLVETQRRLGAADEAVWTGVARAILNLEEFTTRE